VSSSGAGRFIGNDVVDLVERRQLQLGLCFGVPVDHQWATGVHTDDREVHAA